MLYKSPLIDNRKYWHRLGWALWLLPMLAIATMIVVHPLYRSMTPGYHDAVANWWARQSVYTGPTGFNYLPSFLLFFSLIDWLPLTTGEIFWRWIAFGGLGFGLWCFCEQMAHTENSYRRFAVATLLSLPICISALRNGQSSAHLAACLVLAAACLQRQRWWWATLWLCLALICKPLGIVAIGLAVIMFPPLRWRTTLGVVVVVICPYIVAPATYVNEQYVAFAHNLVNCFDTGERTFADLSGVLMVFDINLKGMPSLIVRVTAGVAIAIVCWLTGRLGGDIRRVLLWFGFTAVYIMLFTPMNEANSYVMLAPALGLWACWHVDQRFMLAYRSFVAMSLTILLLSDLVGLLFGSYGANQFAKFWNPFMTLIFLGSLLWQVSALYQEIRENIFNVDAY